jgi:hypothetical protein
VSSYSGLQSALLNVSADTFDRVEESAEPMAVHANETTIGGQCSRVVLLSLRLLCREIIHSWPNTNYPV